MRAAAVIVEAATGDAAVKVADIRTGLDPDFRRDCCGC
jgi:hypothetical protein